jgi:hypothetical protein
MDMSRPRFVHVSGRHQRAGALALLGLLLTGCEAQFSAELSTDPPADPAIAQVQASLLGVELRMANGGTAKLQFNDAEPVDLLDVADGGPFRLFTDEELRPGDYTGIRMLFDSDADMFVTDTSGGEFPIQFAEGEFADVDFTVVEDERSDESLTLTLDLRQSLEFDDSDDDYTFTPTVRVVRTGDAARVEGTVSVTCPVGTTLADGGAVYLFEGEDVEADDLDGAGAEPYATTRVHPDASLTRFVYELQFLPAGDYTLALTCRGDEEEPGSNDDLGFRSLRNLSLDDGETLQLNLN